eukprot:272686-Pleurochrysis_carterae.AAC.1
MREALGYETSHAHACMSRLAAATAPVKALRKALSPPLSFLAQRRRLRVQEAAAHRVRAHLPAPVAALPDLAAGEAAKQFGRGGWRSEPGRRNGTAAGADGWRGGATQFWH